MRRSDQRRDAVFACYQRDVTGRPLEELVAESRPFTRSWQPGSRPTATSSTRRSPRHAKGWELERIAPLERNLMRVALYEIEHSDDVPTEVAIDEAVEIAKEYCGADAPGFVNGVLGAVVREREARAVSRLREISERLAGDRRASWRAAEADDARAAELAREAAELSAEAVEEANRRIRESEAAAR